MVGYKRKAYQFKASNFIKSGHHYHHHNLTTTTTTTIIIIIITTTTIIIRWRFQLTNQPTTTRRNAQEPLLELVDTKKSRRKAKVRPDSTTEC
jgi:heme/copper-type cytochrome/quinol oxidase subunit 2